MVEVGSIQIGGSIQTSEIERGLSRVEKGFKDVERTGKGVNADFTRIDQVTGRLAKRMSVLGLLGGSAMIAMAKGSPAVAGAMAKLKVEGGKLARTMGEILKPAFDWAADSFQQFVGWIQEHSPQLREFTTNVIDALSESLQGVKFWWDKLSGAWKDLQAKLGIKIDLTGDIVKEWGIPAAAALLAKIVGKGKIGWKGAGAIGLGVKAFQETGQYVQGEQGLGQTIGSVGGAVGGGILGAKYGAMAGTAVYPGYGTAIGGFVGGVGGAIGGEKFLGWLGEFIDKQRRGTDRRDLSMQIEYTL
jgi:hypothetical protein